MISDNVRIEVGGPPGEPAYMEMHDGSGTVIRKTFLNPLHGIRLALRLAFECMIRVEREQRK